MYDKTIALIGATVLALALSACSLAGGQTDVPKPGTDVVLPHDQSTVPQNPAAQDPAPGDPYCRTPICPR